MAVLTILLLTFGLLPLASSSADNPAPCMPAKHNNAHNVFLKRHLPEGVPEKSLDQNLWGALLRQIKTCGRPTQSFFSSNKRQQVENVCTSSGGKALSGNLCISKEPFNFVTVRINIDEGMCGIKSVRNETKHIILGCDRIDNLCQPVHFEGNPTNLKPNSKQIDCGYSPSEGSGSKLFMHEALLFTALILLASIL